MRIQITGRHVGVTETMKEYAREKIEKLERIYGRMTTVEVTLEAGHDRTVAEIVASANRGVRLVGKAESPDMYAAIDLAEEKLARQLVRHKQRLTDHERGGPSMGSILPAPPRGGERPAREETYEEIVEKMRDDEEP